MKRILIILLFFPFLAFSQAIEIVSYGENPLEVDPLIGADLTINYKYTSEVGSTGNNIYIGLEILDATNNYVSTVAEITLTNLSAGTNKEGNISFFIGSSNALSAALPTGNYYQVKAILYASGGFTANAFAGYWNTPLLTIQNTSNYQFSTNIIAKGADISWMTEMESDNFIWKDTQGNTKELLPLLKEYNLDAVRLRVWVNPENSGAKGWCDIDDLVNKAVLAKAQNMDIMVCIHYSDWWADPGKQNKPEAWLGFSISELETAVKNHTTAILSALNDKGITPKWVQVGNETNNGILWEDGKASTGGFANYAKFINAGLKTVKNYNTNIKTILNLANGNDNELYKWNIGGLIDNGLNQNQLDIIGMSLYPDENNWKTLVEDTYNNMLDLKARYNKDVLMAEVGFENSKPVIAHQFLTYMIEKTKQAAGLGVFYWEPIAHKNWKSYSKGAWNNDGSPSIAMNAFLDRNTLHIENVKIDTSGLFEIFPNPSSDTITINSLKTALNSISIYDVNGKLVQKIKAEEMLKKIDISKLEIGIYFININKKETLKFIKSK